MSFQCKGEISIKDVEVFLGSINKYHLHKRMFRGTQGSWLGTQGTFDIALSLMKNLKGQYIMRVIIAVQFQKE